MIGGQSTRSWSVEKCGSPLTSKAGRGGGFAQGLLLFTVVWAYYVGICGKHALIHKTPDPPPNYAMVCGVCIANGLLQCSVMPLSSIMRVRCREAFGAVRGGCGPQSRGSRLSLLDIPRAPSNHRGGLLAADWCDALAMGLTWPAGGNAPCPYALVVVHGCALWLGVV